MARKSSLNYKKTVRSLNKAVKAIDKANTSTTKTKKASTNTSGLSNISTVQQPQKQGCLLPFLIFITLPIATALLI